MMSAVREINRRFLERTLLFLLFVSIIPWPTALAAEYASKGSPAASTAAVLYAGTMLLMGLSFWSGWRYLNAHPSLVAEPARGALEPGRTGPLLGALVYLLAIAPGTRQLDGVLRVDALVAIYFAPHRSEVPGLISRAAQAPGPG